MLDSQSPHSHFTHSFTTALLHTLYVHIHGDVKCSRQGAKGLKTYKKRKEKDKKNTWN